MLSASGVNWTSVAIILAAALALSWIYFRTSLPKKTKQQVVVVGAAIVLLAIYSGLLTSSCPSCGGGGTSLCTVGGQEMYCGCTTSTFYCANQGSCQVYFDYKGWSASDVAAKCPEHTGGGTTPTDNAETNTAEAQSAQSAWLSSQRSSCTAQDGIFFDPDSYYCLGFPNTFTWSYGGETEGVPDKYLSAESGCCLHADIVKKSEASTVSFPSGDSNNYRELLSSPVVLTEQKVINGSACLTDFYLCSDPILSGSGTLQTISCNEEDTIYCPNQCDFGTASCSGVQQIKPKTQTIDMTMWYILLGVGVIAIVGFVMFFKKRRRNLNAPRL